MLSVSRYPRTYVEACERKIDAQIAAFNALKGGAELKAFAPLFFNHMVLALDRYFNHRARGGEGKDGNALNEVRMLCQSLSEGDKVKADSTIKYGAETAVLELAIGDKIVIDAEGFAALANAFFAELKKRYA